ncbi:uncharacterized protein ACNLHF_013911 [Anomaloglossus baeobatrachus]
MGGVKMSLTTPTVMTFPFGKKDLKTTTMSMFLSPKLTNPPMPLTSEKSTLTFQRVPKSSHYVKSYSGNVSSELIKQNILNLAKELTEVGIKFNSSFVAYNCYDPTNKYSHHHNEVWFLASQN